MFFGHRLNFSEIDRKNVVNSVMMSEKDGVVDAATRRVFLILLWDKWPKRLSEKKQPPPLFECTFDKITKETDAASYNATDQLQCDLEKEPRLTCCRKAFLKAGWMSWSKIESFSHSWPDREFIFPRCGRQTCPTMLLSIPMQLQKHRRGCSRGFAVQSCLQKC